MTPEVERLSALLTRVQENRQKPRAVGQQAPANVARATAIETMDERAAAKASPPPPPPPQPVKRPAIDRRPTPLELAVTGELDRELPSTQQEARPLTAPVVEPKREPPVRALRPATTPIDPPVAPQPIQPRFIEPDPPREVNRPIAQVVSKHAPPADATFGAMLKRSLSLRPH